ncbi:MAG: glycosyltransferase family 4 protein [Gemmatimonadales bacterium]
MRIVLLITTNGWRGSGVSYAKIARGLLDRGHAVHVVTASSRVTDRMRSDALPVTQLPRPDTGPREVFALWRTLRRTGAEAILTNAPRDVRLSAYATLFHPARIVYRYNLNYRSSRSDIMDRVYLRRVAACFYQSRYIRKEAYAHAPRLRRLPSLRIPNGYDTAFLSPDPDAGLAFRERHGIESHATVVLSSAKLTPGKGHEVALEALHRVRRDGVNLVYVVCGDGSRERELREMAGRLALRTVFTGLLAPTEMVAALSATDVVVHPSLREIFPNAVGEAMSCGLPVVAADAGGTSELLGRGGATGMLVAPGEVEPLADAVHLLADNRELRHQLGAAARRRIVERFPLKRMIDGYESGLAEVVGVCG